jgi:hypothetical protein
MCSLVLSAVQTGILSNVKTINDGLIPKNEAAVMT